MDTLKPIKTTAWCYRDTYNLYPTLVGWDHYSVWVKVWDACFSQIRGAAFSHDALEYYRGRLVEQGGRVVRVKIEEI